MFGGCAADLLFIVRICCLSVGFLVLLIVGGLVGYLLLDGWCLGTMFVVDLCSVSCVCCWLLVWLVVLLSWLVWGLQ